MALYRNIAGFDDLLTWEADVGSGGKGTANEVFYDPGYAGGSGPYPAPDVVYTVRKDEPVTPIQTVSPTSAAGVSPPVGTPEVVAPVLTTVAIEDEPGTKMLPLLTLGFLYATMLQGDRFFGGRQGLFFLGGLGLLYYQFRKQTGDTVF